MVKLRILSASLLCDNTIQKLKYFTESFDFFDWFQQAVDEAEETAEEFGADFYFDCEEYVR